MEAMTQAAPASLAAAMPRPISSSAVCVSMITASAPARTRAAACSRKAASTASRATSPYGSIKPPNGPMSPIT